MENVSPLSNGQLVYYINLNSANSCYQMENENGDGINAGGMCKCAGDSQLIVYFHLFFPMLIVLETNLASISNFYRLDNMRIL